MEGEIRVARGFSRDCKWEVREIYNTKFDLLLFYILHTKEIESEAASQSRGLVRNRGFLPASQHIEARQT